MARAGSAVNVQGNVFRLDLKDRQEILKLRKKEKDARICSRYLALLWLDDGKSVEEVASLLGRDPSCLRKWVKLFKKATVRLKANVAASFP